MFPIRQIFRVGARLAVKKEFGCTRQILPKNSVKIAVDFHRGRFVSTKTDPRESQETETKEKNSKPLGKIEKKLNLLFTCKRCNTRNNKMISKVAYEKGVVIIRCDGCKNNHLIADNLGWFSEYGKSTNIEKILAAKGETVWKIQNHVDGYIEAVAYSELQEQENIEKSTDEGDTAKQREKHDAPEKS